MFGKDRVHWKKRKTMKHRDTYVDGSDMDRQKAFKALIVSIVVVLMFVVPMGIPKQKVSDAPIEIALSYRNIDVCYWSKYFEIECIECMIDFTQNTSKINNEIYRCYVHSDMHPRNQSTLRFRNQSVHVTLTQSANHRMIYDMDIETDNGPKPIETHTITGVSDFVRILYRNISKISFTKMCHNITRSVFLMDSIQLPHLLL